MKKYLLFSTLSYIWISLMIELLMSAQPGFITFAGFHWFLNLEILSPTHLATNLIQGLSLSFMAYLYINKQSSLEDGFRFGLITGLLFILVVLFNMMVQIDHNIYSFFNDSLLSLVCLQLLGFALNGWLFGLMYEIFSPKTTNVTSLWSIA